MAQGIVLAAYIYTLSHSVELYGIWLLVRFAPQFLFVFWVGKLVDRYSRRYVTTLIQILLGITSVAMAGCSEHLVVMMLLTLFAGVVELPYQPALLASIPSLVRQEHLPKANGIMSVLSGCARMVGAGLAALGLLTKGIVWLLLFNAGTFFISAIVIWISLPTKNEDRIKQEEVSQEVVSQRRGAGLKGVGIGVSLRYLWQQRTLKFLVLGSTLLWECLSLSDVLLVPILAEATHGGEKTYGIYRFIATMGMAFGSYFSVHWHRKFANDGLLSDGFAVPLLVASLSTIALALWPWTIGYLAYFLLWMAVMLPSNLLTVELQQTPNAIRGQVMTFADAIDGMLFISVMVIIPQWVKFTDEQTLLWMSTIPFLLVAIIWTIRWLSHTRQLGKRVDE